MEFDSGLTHNILILLPSRTIGLFQTQYTKSNLNVTFDRILTQQIIWICVYILCHINPYKYCRSTVIVMMWFVLRSPPDPKIILGLLWDYIERLRKVCHDRPWVLSLECGCWCLTFIGAIILVLRVCVDQSYVNCHMLQISYSHNTPHTNTNTSSLCHAVIQLRLVENLKLVSNSEYQTRLFECTVDIILSVFLYILPILYLWST